MRWTILLSAVLAIGLPVLAVLPANAQASRTWISGTGNDGNPCSRTSPCKTWAGAMSQTAAGGEIDALDPGGFGTVTINKSITLDGGGFVAGIEVSGTNGLVVNAGASDVVILRNMKFNGLLNTGSAGVSGIRFIAGAQLNIENCDIYGFNNFGVEIALNQATPGYTIIRNSTFRNIAGNGVNATGVGAGTAVVTVVKSSFHGAQAGLAGGGVLADNNSVVAITESDFSDLAAAVGAKSNGNLTLDRSILSRNLLAVNSLAGSAVNVTSNLLLNNAVALSPAGTISSNGNNTIVGPLGSGPNGAALPKQ